MIKEELVLNDIKYVSIESKTYLWSVHRDMFLLNLLKNKKIIHIWPCDSPFTKARYESKDLLYQKLDQIVDQQVWIDVDVESIEFLNSKNFQKSHIVPINLDKLEIASYWSGFEADFILMWDVIEHIMNLEHALSFVKSLMKESSKLIITTPNAARLDIFLSNFLNRSSEHTDHKVWFQLVHLVNLLESNGLKIEEYYLAWSSVQFISWTSFGLVFLRKTLSFLNLMLVKFFPLFGSTHILICKIK